MRAPVRELTFVQKLLYKISQITVALVIVFLLGSSLLPTTFAQTSTTTQNPTIDHYLTPRVDSNVPQNLGTLTQSITLEVMATLVCQIAGIDPIAPTQPCLGINPQTQQLGYTPNTVGDSEIKVGGLLGMAPGLFATLYTPTTSTTEYVRYIGEGFGIVKSAYAAPTGFESLSPVLNLWKAMRNIAYMILILAFIFIGLGVMLRIKIDPRTVMTIQNQVPRIVICILLITFSYPIAGLMVDGMWLVTYAGINVITTAGANPDLGDDLGSLSQESTKSILQTPLAFINAVQSTDHNAYIHITDAVSKGISAFFGDIVASIFNTGAGDTDCSILNFSIKNCVAAALGTVVDWILRVVLYLIIFTTLLVTLFRIWFMLLKAYVFVLLYVIGGPIWIVFGLLPGRPLGFEKWIRAMFVNLMAFPLVAFVFVGGRVLSELFKENPGDKFVTPLTGNPSMENFGILIAFGLLLMAPRILTMLQEAMKTPGTKHGAAIGAGMAAGAAPVAAFAGNRWQHLNKVNPHTGEAIGMVARKKQEIGEKVLQKASNMNIPFATGALANRKFLRENHQSFGNTTQKERKENFKANDWWNRNNMETQWKKDHGQDAKSTQEARTQAYNQAHPEAGNGLLKRMMQRKNRKGGPETPPPPAETGPVVPPPTGPKTSPQGGGAAATPPKEEQHQQKPPEQAPQEGKKEGPTEHVGTLNVNADKANVTISGDHGESKDKPDANAPTHGIMPHNQHDPKWVEKLKEKGNEELHGKSLEEIGGDPVLKQKYERLLREFQAQQQKPKKDGE